LAHLADERVTEVGTRVIYDAIRESADYHTQQMAAMLAEIAMQTTDHQLNYKIPGDGTLQPLDVFGEGNPQPVRPSGSYNVAFPIQGGGDAFGDNRVTRALMTVEEANRRTLDSLKRDADWMKRHMLAAVLDNASWTFTDEQYGDLTIQPLANGDSVEYPVLGSDPSTDDHYLAQASSIDDSNNPLDDIYDELMEHPSNAGPVKCYVPSNLTSSIEGLTAFVPVGDTDIDYGTSQDLVGTEVDPGWGDEVLGKADKCWIVHARILPDNYMIAQAVGGGPVLGMREFPSADLQGFFTEEYSPDGNLREMRMIRYAGFGAMRRIGALVCRIGNGSYAIPSGYDAPLSA
jgi:hypothetical protein